MYGSVFSGDRVRRVGRIDQHLHAERASPPGDSPSDLAESDQAERLGAQASRPARDADGIPLAVSGAPIERDEPATRGKNESESVVRDLFRAEARHVADPNASLRRCRDIDVVVTDSVFADDLHFYGQIQQIGGDRGCIAQNRVSVRDDPLDLARNIGPRANNIGADSCENQFLDRIGSLGTVEERDLKTHCLPSVLTKATSLQDGSRVVGDHELSLV